MTGDRFARNLLLVVIAVFTFARFYNLDRVPFGFYVDEATDAVEALCIAEEGISSYIRERLPIFFRSSTTGVLSPTWVYSASLWSELFGPSIISFRALSGCATLLTIAGVYFLGRELFGERAGRFALLCATISPWAFQFSRVAWDPVLFPMFLVWGLFLLVRARDARPGDAALAGLLFALAAYSYAAGRVMSILLLLTFWVFPRLLGHRDRWMVARAGAVFAVASLSILINYANGVLAARASYLSIFRLYREQGLYPMLERFVSNYLSHLGPSFLLVRGDGVNLRHTTHYTGVLSWTEALGWLALLGWLAATLVRAWTERKLPRARAELLLISAILIGILPAALTVDDMPHALRSSGAWPFVALGAGRGLALLTECRPHAVYLAALLTAGFTVYFLGAYFTHYARTSNDYFDGVSLVEALAAARTGDWSRMHTERHEAIGRYYLMAYAGRSCEQSRLDWLRGHRRKEDRLVPPYGINPLFVQLGLIALCLPLAALERRKDRSGTSDETDE